jgi:hypothetical protein
MGLERSPRKRGAGDILTARAPVGALDAGVGEQCTRCSMVYFFTIHTVCFMTFFIVYGSMRFF